MVEELALGVPVSLGNAVEQGESSGQGCRSRHRELGVPQQRRPIARFALEVAQQPGKQLLGDDFEELVGPGSP